MNGLKIRKLAAVIAGGALLGAAVAPMVSAISGSDAKSVVYNADMSPVVNIVVGKSAAVSDGVWAGNIARKVVEKAVMTKTYTGGAGESGSVVVSDLAAVLSLGGTVTVTGGKTFDTANLNSSSGNAAVEYGQSLSEDPLSFLKDESISYKYNGSSTSIDVRETVGVDLDAKFDTDQDVRDLVAVFGANDVNYVLNLGGGIPTNDTDDVVGDFSDDSDDNIRIPFFGKTFLVQTVDQTDTNSVTELRLIEDKAKQTFVAGESFTMAGKGAYTGQTLTVTVVSIVATGPATTSYQAKFNLTDEAGNMVDTQTTAAGAFIDFEDDNGDEVVNGDIYVDSASVNTGTNEGTVDVLVGTSSVRLLDGQNYPYSEDADEENIDGPYVVTLNETATTNRLTSVVISNQAMDDDEDSAAGELIATYGDSIFDDDNPLYSNNSVLTEAGEDGPYEFSFLDGTGALGEDFFKITFNGFENDEEMTYVQVGNNEITFRDVQDSTHTIPMWFVREDVDQAAKTATSDGSDFTFDESQSLWWDINTTSQDFNVVNGTLLNGVAVVLGSGRIWTDNGTRDVNAGASTVTISGVTYSIADDDGNGASGVTLTADGYVRIADAELTSSVSTSDLVQGLGGLSNVTGVTGGTTTANLAGVFFYDDANHSGTTIGVSMAPMLLPLSGDNYTVAYSYFVEETADEGLYFMLAGDITNPDTTGNGVTIPYNSTLQNSKRLSFVGTDTAEDGTVDKNFFFPQIDELGQDDGSTTVYASTFQVDENGGTEYPIRFYIDNQTFDISDTIDDDIAVPTSDVNYGWNGSGIGGTTLSLKFEDSDDIEKAFTDFGTKISIADHKTVELWIPENRPQVEFIVTGASSTTTVEGGEELTVAEGETGTFSTGTSVAVKDITYTAGISDGSTVVTNGTAFTYTTMAPLNGKAQIYTTDSSVPGPKIIVGGPLVNSLASEVADELNQSGDMVSGVYSGNIIVAGYTATDTGAAAQDLISALDGM
ncbi:MAG: hypothetical protein V1776_01210 [Candidatus Diapherotrites archaeon]